MKLIESEVIAERFTVIHTLTIKESRNSGRLFWTFRLRQIRRHSAWLWSKSLDLLKHQVTEDVMDMWTHVPISHSLDTWRPSIQPSSMPIRANHDSKVWCDICKVRYGKVGQDWHTLAMTPARWIVISETHERKGRTKAYCQPCANFAQTRHDGSEWSFKDQLEYALGQEKINGMES